MCMGDSGSAKEHSESWEQSTPTCTHANTRAHTCTHMLNIVLHCYHRQTRQLSNSKYGKTLQTIIPQFPSAHLLGSYVHTCAQNHFLPCKEFHCLGSLGQALFRQKRWISNHQVKLSLLDTVRKTQGLPVVIIDELFSVTLEAFVVFKQNNVMVRQRSWNQFGEESRAGYTGNPSNKFSTR